MIFRTSRRQAVAGALLIAVGSAGAALAQQAFFRIGTGGTGGTYYPIGGLIAQRDLGPDGGKGVAGLVATAVASNGSVANVNGIVGGSMESGFTQSDVAYWAYTGTGIYEGKPKVEDLRVIANLYPESVHIVARRAPASSRSPTSRASASRSTSRARARWSTRALMLAAFGVTEKDIKPEYLKPARRGDKLKDGSLDAYLLRRRLSDRARSPSSPPPTASSCCRSPAPQVDKLLAKYKFFAKDKIPAGVYKDVGERETIAVGAQWVTTRQAAGRSRLRDHQGAVERQDARRARRRPRQGQGDHAGDRATGRRHSAASRRREVLQGSGPAEVTEPSPRHRRERGRPVTACHPLTVLRDGAGMTTRARERHADARQWNSTRRRPGSSRRSSTPRCASGRSLPLAALARRRAARRAVAVPLLHGRLRPAARDDAPRHPPLLRARPHLPRLPVHQARLRRSRRRRACFAPLGIPLVDWLCAIAAVVAVLYVPLCLRRSRVPRRQSRPDRRGSSAPC